MARFREFQPAYFLFATSLLVLAKRARQVLAVFFYKTFESHGNIALGFWHTTPPFLAH